MAWAIAIILTLLVLVLVLKYPPLSLFFFLTTSFVKPILMMNITVFQSIDYTVLCGVLVLFAMCYSFIRSGGRLGETFSFPMGLFLALVLLLLFGATYTSAPTYGFQKSSRFAVLGFIAFAAPIFFCTNTKHIKQILNLLIIIGIPIALGTIIAPHAAVFRANVGTRASFLETSPLHSATMMAAGALICFCYAIFNYTSRKVRITSLIVIPTMLVAIIMSGSRGPFIGLGLCIVMSVYLCRRQLSKIAFPLVFVLLIASAIIIIIKLPKEQTRRMMKVFSAEHEMQSMADDRLVLFKFVLVNFHRRPILGHGTGAYAMDNWGIDEQKYPHNIILELLYENGFIGVILFLLFMWQIYRRWKRTKKTAMLFSLPSNILGSIDIVALLLMFTLFQAMKSSDIDGNRFMFFCCGMVLACFKCINDECSQIERDSMYYESLDEESDEMMLQEQLVGDYDY